eukprot:2093610-Amphidinium_carterae.1
MRSRQHSNGQQLSQRTTQKPSTPTLAGVTTCHLKSSSKARGRKGKLSGNNADGRVQSFSLMEGSNLSSRDRQQKDNFRSPSYT